MMVDIYEFLNWNPPAIRHKLQMDNITYISMLYCVPPQKKVLCVCSAVLPTLPLVVCLLFSLDCFGIHFQRTTE